MFVLAFIFSWLFFAAKLFLLLILILIIVDAVLIFAGNSLKANRILPEKFSNGDENGISVQIANRYSFPVSVVIIDEIPFQFQVRDFKIVGSLAKSETKSFYYNLRPTERGLYDFGNLNVYVQSPMGLVSRRFVANADAKIPVYPSFLQMRRYDLMAFSNRLFKHGLRRIRRIGHTMEFEQIKDYVKGDDIRSVNWKATAKKGALMVNQFQDEKSQSVYMLIDKGRVMKMPFAGLSLMDYAINATLAISNVILKKNDKAGMLAFSRKVEDRVVAEKRASQMQRIMESLYNIRTDFYESDYSRLFVDLRKNIKQRSLLLLFTNLETLEGLTRQLPYLKSIAKNHLLVVIFFENTELDMIINTSPKTVKEIYDVTIAEKFALEKKLIVSELKKFGIYSLLTKPENLTAETINKYLEIKARGIL